MIATNITEEVHADLTLSGVRHILTGVLSHAGIEEASYEARLLIQRALGLTSLQFILQETRQLSLLEATRLQGMILRRLTHEPLSRIEGVRMFYGRTFHITPSVLDPRPETEILVDVIREFVSVSPEENWPRRILDVGTGSGCVIVSLLAELPFAKGMGTDLSLSALNVAYINACHHKVDDRLFLRETQSLEGIDETFDVLVCNPPYIPTSKLKSLEPAVKNFDPACALDGGNDGLKIYREIASKVLKVVPCGWIVLEVGYDQGLAVGDLFQNELRGRIEQIQYQKDLNGHLRCVAIKTQN